MLKASSALVGFLLAPQAALAQLAAPVLTATAGDGQVTLNWTFTKNPGDDDPSRWWYRQGTTAHTILSGGPFTRTHTVTGLTNGTPYTFKVYGDARISGRTILRTSESNAVTVTPTATPTAPAAPTGFTAAAGNGEVTLNWTKPAGTITGYKLLYSKTGTRSSATWAVMTGAGANTVRHTVSSLDNGSEYSFKIRAVNGGGDGTETGWVTATPFTTALTVTPGDKQVTLN